MLTFSVHVLSLCLGPYSMDAFFAIDVLKKTCY